MSEFGRPKFMNMAALGALLSAAASKSIGMADAIKRFNDQRRTFFADFHIEMRRRNLDRPRNFWMRPRYPLEELRRLSAERGSGSVRRIDPALRATFKATRKS